MKAHIHQERRVKGDIPLVKCRNCQMVFFAVRTQVGVLMPRCPSCGARIDSSFLAWLFGIVGILPDP